MRPWFHKTHNRLDLLNIRNPMYCDWIFWCLTEQFEKDLGKGDITTDILFRSRAQKHATAKIIAKQKGVLAGRMEIDFFLAKAPKKFRLSLNKLAVKFCKKDGDEILAGNTICEIRGSIKDILKVERTVLNFLGRMSGIATAARRTANRVRTVNRNILVTPTRKTLWGLLDKRACAIGGCGTHRLNLNDAILIKDNHLDIYKRNIETTIRKFFPLKLKPVFFEIEVSNKIEALKASREFKKLKNKGLLSILCFIMLDNFSIRNAAETIGLLKKMGLRDLIGIEISGGIIEKNIIQYAKTGPDIISMGALTHSVPSLGFSLDSH